MNTEEAIRMLTRLKDQINFEWTDAQKKMDALNVAIEALKAQKKGEWKPIEKGEKGYSAGDFRCSVCGQPNKCYCLTDFCPNCGADMRGEEDD